MANEEKSGAALPTARERVLETLGQAHVNALARLEEAKRLAELAVRDQESALKEAKDRLGELQVVASDAEIVELEAVLTPNTGTAWRVIS